MLNFFSGIVEKILAANWPNMNVPSLPDIAFAIPNDEWHTKVVSSGKSYLDIYLIEIRENLSFRRPGWELGQSDSSEAVYYRPPAYLDCSYLISAWSPITDESLNPAQDEHELLGEALRILLQNPVVIPNDLGLGSDDPLLKNAEVYLALAPPDAPRVLNDFWSTMKQPWKPAIHLIVTAPLDLLMQQKADTPLMTFTRRYVLRNDTDIQAGSLSDIGGLVLMADGNKPIEKATVERLADDGTTLQQATTDSQGRYVLYSLPEGKHHLRVSAKDYQPVERDINVPDLSTEKPLDTHVFKMTA